MTTWQGWSSFDGRDEDDGDDRPCGAFLDENHLNVYRDYVGCDDLQNPRVECF